MRDRNRFPVIAGVPGPPHERIAFNVLNERFRGAVAVQPTVLERPTQLAAGQTLPAHRRAGERPIRGARHPGRRIVRVQAVAVCAAHGAGAVIVGTTNDAGNMRAARVAPQGCFKLMAIETAGMLQDRGDLVPCRQSFDRTGRSGRLAESAPREQRRSQSSGGGRNGACAGVIA